jgi:hypothetical protein
MRKMFVITTVVSLLFVACGQAAPTPDTRIPDLETRIAALESQIAELSSDEHGEPAAGSFDVVVAQYVMDSAGFHGMDETLNETKTVDPGYRSVVLRVRKVVVQTAWPEDLADQSAAFAETLEEFAAALEADDGEEAATLAAEAHTAQHDLSRAIDEMMGVGGEHH